MPEEKFSSNLADPEKTINKALFLLPLAWGWGAAGNLICFILCIVFTWGEPSAYVSPVLGLQSPLRGSSYEMIATVPCEDVSERGAQDKLCWELSRHITEEDRHRQMAQLCRAGKSKLECPLSPDRQAAGPQGWRRERRAAWPGLQA